MTPMAAAEVNIPAVERVLVKISITSPLLGETIVARSGPSANRAFKDSRSDVVSAMNADTREAHVALAKAVAAAVEALSETE